MTKVKYPELSTSQRSGMTLPEVLIVIVIFGMVMAGLTSFYMQTSKMMFISDQKLKINADIRNLTNEMSDNARDANHFTIYESFYLPFTNPPEGEVPESYRQRDGQSGDFLLLIFYGDDPNPADTVPPPKEKLIGYYRSIEDSENNMGPVRKFERNIPFGEQYKIIEELIPKPDQESNFSKVIELSRGLADGHLFYNFRDRSIMVNGQIYHGNDAKRVTDTYNFTISPRG